MNERVRTGITEVTLNEGTYHNVTLKPSLINLFFGGNGAGKTTICKANLAGKGLTWSGPIDAGANLMVFNDDYIKNNIQSYGNIPGVFSLTEEDAAIRKELNEKTQEKMDIDVSLQNEETLATELIQKRLSLDEEYWNQVWSKTETWRKTDFPRTQTRFSGSKKKFFEELHKKERIQGNHADLLSRYQGAFVDRPIQYKLFEDINPDFLPMTDLLAKPIISTSDSDFARFVRAIGNLDWVRHGHDHYLEKAEGICPFCQNPLDKAKFEAGLISCFGEQYQKDIASLNQFVQIYKDKINQLSSVIKHNLDIPLALSFLDNAIERYRLVANDFFDKANSNIVLLDQKLKEPAKEIIDFKDLQFILAQINVITADINVPLSAYNRFLRDPEKKTKIYNDIWSFMAYECRELFEDYDNEWSQIDKEIKINGDAISKLREKSAALKTEISRLNAYTANTTQVMESINNTLHSIGFMGFHLREKAGTSYMYELVRENGEPAQGLSEGERNFIALLYFYHTVMATQRRDGLAEDKIVVIDDPVSSMDHNTLFYVSTLIREMMEICYRNYALDEDPNKDKHIKQFFCLTHNSVFFRNISYDRLNDYESVIFYEITKDEKNHSHVDEKYETMNETGGGRINLSPARNYYDSLWHVFRTTTSKEVLMATARQILDYYFLQSDGYKSSDIRILALKDKDKYNEGQDKRYPQCDALDPGPGTHAIQYIHSGTFSFLRPIYGTVFSEKFVQNAQFPSAPMRVLAGGIYTLFLCRINSTVA